jgi:hypothetical protein
MLARGGKKKPTNGVTNGVTNGGVQEPPSCPVGFVWDEGLRSCIPSGEGPPQIHVTGLCEAWQLLPSPQVWFDTYAGPAMVEIAQAIQAAPHTDAAAWDYLRGTEEMHPAVVAHVLLSNSPIAFATPEFQTLGQLCKLPLSEELGPDPEPGQPVPVAMADLAQYVTGITAQAIRAFNESGQFQIPEVPA